jgi:hypothetical protein
MFVGKWGDDTMSARKFLKAHLVWRKGNGLAKTRKGKEKQVEGDDDEDGDEDDEPQEEEE